MAVEADGRWHRKIDAYHTYRDLGNETLGRISIAREDRNRVAFGMDVRVAQRRLDLECTFKSGASLSYECCRTKLGRLS